MATNFFSQFHGADDKGLTVKASDPNKVAKDRNAAAASAYDPAKAAADLQGQQILNALNEQKVAEAKRQAEEATIKEQERQDAIKQEADAKAANIAKIERAVQLLDDIQNDAADNGGWFETGASGAFARKHFPEGSPAYDLKVKTDRARAIQFVETIKELKAASKTGSTGAGGLTETEGKKFEDAVAAIDPNLSQPEFLNQIKTARDTFLESYRRLGGTNPKIDPDLAKSAPQQKLAPAQQDTLAPATNSRTEIDPMRKAVLSRVGQMVAGQNPNRRDVEDFIRSNNMDPGSFNLDKLFQYRASPDFIKWQRAHPGQPFAPDPKDYTREVPLSGTAAAMNKVAQSAPGAYAASAANAIAGGHLDDLGGESVNTGLMLMQQQHPGASFLGDMSGQMLTEAGLGRIPGVGRLGHVGMDALYGGYAGSGSEQGGILSGAIGNVAGGGLARGATKAAGGILKGVNNANLSYLNDRGVPLTIGQIGRGSDTTLGHGVAGIEERMAGLPITDAIIGSARQRGDVGFNREMFRQVGAPVGNPGVGNIGVQGLQDARKIRNGAYSFLDSASMARDPAYDAANASLTAGLPNLPDFGPAVQRKADLINGSFDPSGGMSGRDWQSAIRSIRGDRGKIARQPFGEDAANALGRMETNLSDLAVRQVPGAGPKLAAANAVNANYKTVQAALKGRAAQRSGVLTDPTTLNAASIRGAEKFGGIDNALTGNRPFYDLTTAGMDVMPNQTPDSGTAGRSILFSALGGLLGGGGIGAGVGAASDDTSVKDGAAAGGGIGVGSALLPTLLLAGLYSKGGQKTLQKALLGPRSKQAQQYGAAILDPAVQRVFGSLGGATARDLLLHPELKR